MRLLPETHLRWILDQITNTPAESRELADAFGATLAEDVVAAYDLPHWPNSAMDGYAVRAADLTGATQSSPVRLTVVGAVMAGDPGDVAVHAGEAVRIMTGAPIPPGADLVVPVEQTLGDRAAVGSGQGWADHAVQVLAAPNLGAHIRLQGEDVARGDVIATAGERLGASRLAALAAAGVAEVRVHRDPRIAVIATGSELRPLGTALEHGQIFDSNSLLIASKLRELGLSAVTVRHSADTVSGLTATLAELGATHDAIVTTGGVGPGEHDVVRMALEDEPLVRAVRVEMKPGQPQCAGRLRGGAFIFGLPGNPVSAAVSWELFVRPALLTMLGRNRMTRLTVPAITDAPWRAAAGRLQVQPVTLTEQADGLHCLPAVNSRRVSHSVGSHGATEGYALVAAEHGDVQQGDVVPVIWLAE